MKLVIIASLLSIGTSAYAQSAFKNVILKLPAGTFYPYAQVEPSLAIDPSNPKHMVAGSVLQEYYYSKNGGKRWKSKIMSSEYGVYGDPVLMFDMKSRVYYFHLASYAKTSHLDRIVCQKSDDLKGDFDEGTFPEPNGTKVQDKHWTVVDPNSNVIYMTWTQFDNYNSAAVEDSSQIMFSKSIDQGETWSKPIRISKFGGDCLDDDNTVEGAVPAVGPNGEVYVSWTGPRGLVFQRSMDGGESWLAEELMIEKQYGGWTLDIPGVYRANGLPILKCDLSDGPNKGTLYLNWCDQRNGGEDTDVWIMSSKDGGVSWTEPVRVNQDDSKKHQFFTWICIDQSSGFLYFIYYDRRNYTDNQTDVYVSVSRDGGKTFIDHRVSQTPFVPSQEIFFGDYLNIDAVDGIIRPIWPRMDNQKISLWVALLSEKKLAKLAL